MAAMQDREDQAHKGSRSTLNGKYDMVDVRVVHGARCMLQVAARCRWQQLSQPLVFTRTLTSQPPDPPYVCPPPPPPPPQFFLFKLHKWDPERKYVSPSLGTDLGMHRQVNWACAIGLGHGAGGRGREGSSEGVGAWEAVGWAAAAEGGAGMRR